MSFMRVWKSTDDQASTGISTYHMHDLCEILYLYEGEADMRIGQSSYHVLPHQLVVISRLETHDLYPQKLPYSRIGMHINCDTPGLLGIPPFLRSVLFYRDAGFCHLFDLTNMPQAVDLLTAIEEEYREKLPCSEDMLKHMFGMLLLYLYRIRPNAFHRADADPRMEEARLYLESHFAENFNLDELAEHYYLSPTYFVSCFRHYTGYPPQKYRHLCRMAHARLLLLEGKQSLDDIADACGFSDANGFIRAFRENMGITPGRFRQLSDYK